MVHYSFKMPLQVLFDSWWTFDIDRVDGIKSLQFNLFIKKCNTHVERGESRL